MHLVPFLVPGWDTAVAYYYVVQKQLKSVDSDLSLRDLAAHAVFAKTMDHQGPAIA